MYPQVQGSNNNTARYIGLAVLALLIIGGILLYVFVFKCKEDGGECKTTTDCCEGLECIDSICSSSSPSITPTVTPQPVVEANVVVANPVTEPVTEPVPDTESTTCSVWDINNDCATNTTLVPGVVIGNSQSECCVSTLDCEGTWSACTAACEGTDDRTFTQTQEQFGTGAACQEATDCQPGDGDCKSPWVYEGNASIGMSCYTICRNNEMSCEDGDWGVHDIESVRQILGDQTDSICNGGYGYTDAGIAPYVTGEGWCGYRSMDTEWLSQSEAGESICNRAYESYSRICKCVPDVLSRQWYYPSQEAIDTGLYNSWASCDEVCESVGKTCEDGDWGIHDDTSMRDALSEAGQDPDSLCGASPPFQSQPSNQKVTSPRFKNALDGICYFRGSGIDNVQGGGLTLSRCSGYTDEDSKRLCKCVPP